MACPGPLVERAEMSSHEIMTVEEVARYLRVSERTVYDWAQKGEIPAGKLGTTWRFKRTVVQKWVDEHLTGSDQPAAAARPASVSIRDVLSPQRVRRLKADTKQAALLEMIELLSTAAEVKERHALRTEIFRREDLMSTGIGLGIAVPHVRLASVTDTVMAVGVSSQVIDDYVSLDGGGVSIICMVASSVGQHAKYLKTLAAISTRLRDESVREAVLRAADEDAMYRILAE